MATAQDLIESALRKINILGVGQSLSADEAQDALETLNQMISSWSVEGYLIYNETQESFTLSGAVASYTIGSGQTFNTSRPLEIIAAFVRQAGSSNDYNLTLFDERQYALIPDKTAEDMPEILYYNANYPNGTIYLYPVPYDGSALHIYSRKELSSFSTLQTTVNLPAGWEQAIVFNLAVLLAPEYEREASPTVKMTAANSKKSIKVATRRNDNDSRFLEDTLTRRGNFNILTGQYV